jgi:hypothetical protein
MRRTINRRSATNVTGTADHRLAFRRMWTVREAEAKETAGGSDAGTAPGGVVRPQHWCPSPGLRLLDAGHGTPGRSRNPGQVSALAPHGYPREVVFSHLRPDPRPRVRPRVEVIPASVKSAAQLAPRSQKAPEALGGQVHHRQLATFTEEDQGIV